MENIFTEDEIEKIKEILKEKDELNGFSFDREFKIEGNCEVFITHNGQAKLPIIISNNEGKANEIADKVAQEYSSSNEVFIGIPDYEDGVISDIDLKHIPFKFSK